MKELALLFAILVLPSLALGATISGTIYDLDLSEVHLAIVTIDTVPEQRLVSTEGTYSFTVPEGSYTLEASARIDGDRWVAQEELNVTSDGAYTVDIILAPSFEEIADIDLEEESLPEIPREDSNEYLIPIAILVVLCGIIFYFLTRGPRKIPDDEYRQAVMNVLRKHKRITQKDLRHHVPFSEAKVSLVISELESEGKIRKIRKGRGNIIILNSR